jgi:hypothetical protein
VAAKQGGELGGGVIKLDESSVFCALRRRAWVRKDAQRLAKDCKRKAKICLKCAKSTFNMRHIFRQDLSGAHA